MLGRLKTLLKNWRENMKNKWSNYALKAGKVKESYIREYSSRSPKRAAKEASCCHCVKQSGKEQAKEEPKKEVIATPKIRSERRRRIKKTTKVVKKKTKATKK